jgi:hypothetical protein
LYLHLFMNKMIIFHCSFSVHWRGFDREKDKTWEPESHFVGSRQLLDLFLTKNGLPLFHGGGGGGASSTTSSSRRGSTSSGSSGRRRGSPFVGGKRVEERRKRKLGSASVGSSPQQPQKPMKSEGVLAKKVL